MRWDRLMRDVTDWFDIKIVPLFGEEERHQISLAKVTEEYKELKDAVLELSVVRRMEQITDFRHGYDKASIRILERHVEGEAADLFIALVCYCHANNINLKRAVYATLLKLQKRKWKKTKVPGLVRHVEGT